MAEYAELSSGRVWFDEHGRGEPLVLVHGGAVDGRFFDQNVGGFVERFRVITTDLWGHGHTADREEPFSLDSFASDVGDLIERGVPSDSCGASMPVWQQPPGARPRPRLSARR